MSSEAVVELRGVSKHFRQRHALEDCTLSIPRGRVAAVVGSNGAGKSTMLRIIAGLTTPTRGSVSVLGQVGQSDTPTDLARIGYLDQDRPLYRNFRVRDMLRAGRSTNPRWNEKLAREYLERLAIGQDQKIRELSGGQQAQVALTLSLAKEPELLILDEPAAALDPAARQDLLQLLMAKVAESDLTVLLSTHALDDVIAICDFLVVVVHGQVVLADDLEFILQSHRLVRGASDNISWPDGAVDIKTQHTTRNRLAMLRLELPVVDSHFDFEEPTLDEIVLSYMRSDRVGSSR